VTTSLFAASTPRVRGVNFFDNAEVYAGGESEAIMGRAFRTLGWQRHEYVVSSKFSGDSMRRRT